MKIIFSIILSFAAAWPAFAFELICVSNPPSTSFFLLQTGDIFSVEVMHHYTARYAPMFKGLLTPADLITLKPRADAVMKLPDDYKFTWEMKNCKIHSGYRMECFGSKDEKIVGGVKLSPFGIHTGVTTRNNVAGVYQEIDVDLSLDIDGQPVNVSMTYFPEDCTLNNKMP